MPIPTSEPTTAPRRLLRDVAFDKLLAAIVDGTLEPGERLNDADLAKWLQVSRTPIREAIAQLQTYGLIDIEANRYTKVAARDEAVYAEAAQFLAGLHRLAREWGAAGLEAASRKELRTALSAATKQLNAHEVAGAAALLDLQGALAASSGNELFSRAEEPLRVRMKFLSPRDPEAYDWNALIGIANEIESIVGD